MVRLSVLIAALFAVVSHVELLAVYEELSQEALDTYYAELDKAIANAEERVEALKAKVGDLEHVPMWTDKLELKNAVVQLEVKRTLYANFRGTESLRSPLVRKKLLQVLNTSDISESDLVELQSLVLQEKAKIREASKAALPK